eukprot:SAG31_NODE_1018_length_10354_cov_10.995514_7_plen_30_part_00
MSDARLAVRRAADVSMADDAVCRVEDVLA